MAARKKHQNQTGQNERTNEKGTSTKLKQKFPRRKEKRDNAVEGTVVGDLKQFSKGYLASVIGLALLVSYLHGAHISKMFESDRHFSHLSTLERELAFRTEMGLYYSYFKIIIDAPSFTRGVYSIMNDNITEFPSTINTLKRFNLYPEVVLGAAYRVYDSVMYAMNKPTKQCWTVNRGQGLAPVESCEGLGEPSYFYVDSVFFLNGLMMGVIFLYATFLSGSIFGGILTVLCFFYNHGECTRVQWTPPLRESFAYPFLVVQMLLVTYVLRTERPTYRHSAMIALATVCFMLPWQFAQFALLTQTVSVLGTYVLGFIGSHKMKVVLYGQTVALVISYIFLFGNEMLLTSFYASCLFTVHIILLLEPIVENIKIRPLIWLVQGAVLAVGTITIKMGLSSLFKIADDAHISDIFRSKFADFKNFHTMLYTCAPEFDFMQAETPVKLLQTLLLPSVFIASAGATVIILRNEYQQWCQPQGTEVGGGDTHSREEEEDEEEEDSVYRSRAYRSKPHAEVLYNMFQLLAYTAMAVIIMRLKLFWTPHLCLLASLLASRQFFGWACPKKTHISVLVGLMAVMSIAGFGNLKHQWGIMGEFSNWPQEEMVEWIKAHTPQTAVFAGPMPTMATVKLCTGRPIVNHPHYEDAGLRARTKKVYSMYSRKPVEEVKQNLMDLQVDYAILEDSWCIRRQKPGCAMPEIWDVEDPENKNAPEPTCTTLRRNPGPHFKRVFKNDVYEVLKIVK
ncbi:probable C-mannosyltransferase DPY19L1 [Lingula anatina]|uniref:Probable C-mannosyltransferase DPY19L1 n=1 Tax=Lingula anatina TaxID=7574 RepID=A0A1S3IDV5_LINAN|nr:probable C-mannosyltransferase DPY19L1 [Lingula anatina]|eukprot:XP_013396417.1 probable C-mannosyltransferase DPY19L1 [Lingula anatina]